MLPDFLPSEAALLTAPSSIALVHSIRRQPITIPISPGRRDEQSCTIATAYVQQGSFAQPGQGEPPILLVHGFDSSVLEFRRIMPLLAEQRETWAIDLLGFGFTEYCQGLPINPKTIRQHLYQSWQTLIQRPVTLVGASLGGAVAIDFAIAHPECVSQLILIDSVGFSGSFPLGRLLFPPVDGWAVEWLRFRKQMALNAIAALPQPDPNLLDLLRCSLLHQLTPTWSDATIAFTKSGGYSELTPKISLVQHPTLVLWGEKDDVLGTGDATKFKQAIANSELIWIQDCSHAPQLEQPDITAHHLLNFRRHTVTFQTS